MAGIIVKNIADTLAEVARQYGEKTGLIEAKTGHRVSFAELNRRADAYAAYLASAGVSSGDRVMLMVKPSADFIALTFALFKLGATIILIDPGMGYRNLLRCIQRVAPRVLLGIAKAHLFSRLFPGPFRTVSKRFSCGFSFGLGGPDIRKVAPPVASFPVYQPEATDLAAIIFTTGSTGPPKGVQYEHSIFAAQLRLIRDYYQIDQSHTDQPAFPLFALFAAALGACAVIPDMDPTKPAKVDPKRFIASLNRYGVTYSFGSPALWNVVSRYCLDQGIVLKTIKKILIAGAPVAGELLERVRAILPPDAVIHTPYGATESLPIVSITASEILGETWPQSRIGKGICVGRPLPGIDISIIAISDGPLAFIDQCQLMAQGEVGEIIVRGDVVTRAYVNNPEETALAKIGEGSTFWHRMGDIGYLDEQDRLWFCGRKAHRVVTDRGTLFTIPCEAIINEHQDVFRSALVGVAQQNGGIRPVLIVEARQDFTGDCDQLLREVAELAAASELTRQIDTFLIHPGFPVDIRHNAKIFREKLAVWAKERVGRQ